VNDQQHPHDPWFLIELTSPEVLQSFDNGKVTATFLNVYYDITGPGVAVDAICSGAS